MPAPTTRTSVFRSRFNTSGRDILRGYAIHTGVPDRSFLFLVNVRFTVQKSSPATSIFYTTWNFKLRDNYDDNLILSSRSHRSRLVVPARSRRARP
jgi:hypothetical protein